MRLLYRLAILTVCALICISEVQAAQLAGQTNNSGTDATVGSNASYYIQVTATATGTADSIYIYCNRSDGVDDKVYLAVFADNGSNAPGNLLWQSAPDSVTALVAGAWLVLPVTGLSITASTKYWCSYSAATVFKVSPTNGTTSADSCLHGYNTNWFSGSGAYTSPAGSLSGSGTVQNRAVYIVGTVTGGGSSAIDLTNRHSPTNVGVRHNPGGIGLRHKP